MINTAKNFLIMLMIYFPDFSLLQMHLTFLQKERLKKDVEATDDSIGNKISDKITKFSKISPKNNLETAESETETTGFVREITKERYISPDSKSLMI